MKYDKYKVSVCVKRERTKETIVYNRNKTTTSLAREEESGREESERRQIKTIQTKRNKQRNKEINNRMNTNNIN